MPVLKEDYVTTQSVVLTTVGCVIDVEHSECDVSLAEIPLPPIDLLFGNTTLPELAAFAIALEYPSLSI